jgi:hypothetical protein
MYALLIGKMPTQGKQAPCTDDALPWRAAVQTFCVRHGQHCDPGYRFPVPG